MPGSYVQSSQNSTSSQVGTLVAPSLTVAGGNSMIVAVQCQASNTPTITDTNGNTYIAAGSASAYAAGLQVYYAQAILGGPTQVSATGGLFNGIFANEYSGIGTLLGSAGQNQNGPGAAADAITSGSIAVLNLPAHLFAISFNSTGSGNSHGAPAAGTGFVGINPLWAAIGGSGQTVARAEHMEITGYGSIAGTFTTTNGSDLFITVAAAFLEYPAQTNTATIAWTK
jgi:hypothetical protein